MMEGTDDCMDNPVEIEWVVPSSPDAMSFSSVGDSRHSLARAGTKPVNLCVTVPKPENLEDFCWSSILESIAAVPNLRRLYMTCFFDCSGRASLSTDDLYQSLVTMPSLQELVLDSVGIRVGQERTIAELRAVFANLKSLCSVSLTRVYFVERHGTSSWLHCSLLTQCIVAAPGLKHFELSPTMRFFSRPVLTLSALTELFSHSSIKHLSLYTVALWGAGSATVASSVLSQNVVLEKLQFKDCIFAAPDGSILCGLGPNRSIVHFSIESSKLLPMEGMALAKSLAQNQNLETFDLSLASFGASEHEHHETLCAVLKSFAKHPKLRRLVCRGTFDHAANFEFVENKRLSSEVLRSLLLSVETNRIVTDVEVDRPFDAEAKELYDRVQFCAGVNRSGFWNLSQAHSHVTEWLEALVRVNSCDRGCMFHILQQNPPLISR